MSFDASKHKFVIVQNNDVVFGFPALFKAIEFIENQVIDEDKALDFVKEALDGETDIDGNTYNILDIDSYIDIYTDDEEEDVDA